MGRNDRGADPPGQPLTDRKSPGNNSSRSAFDGNSLAPIFDALDAAGMRPKWRGSTHIDALCPAHNDRNPSLKIDLKGGEVLIHCHANCETGEVLALIGMGW